ncbi:uncharacterized protein [Choristoneura fumiferana]|uniref:uncharacterized protein n=1 Tax=Choristoneura fumiferana TaxID=7141 RepID=UPI003D154D3F
MLFRPRRIPFNFTPKQLQHLSTLFQQNKYADISGRKAISKLLNIPELVIRYFFQNKRLKEKLRQEELNRCAIINRNYALLLPLWENNNASNDSPSCSINKEKQNISSNIRRAPEPKYPDEVFQLFNFCNKNRHKFRQIIIPHQFMKININNNYAIDFYRQYHMYMAKQKARDPFSIEVETFSETFPVIASSEYFQQQVDQMRGQNLGQANPAFTDEVISIGLKSPDHFTDYESSEDFSGEHMEYNRNNIPKQQVNQVRRKESASATQKLPRNITINTFSAQLPTEIFEQQDIPIVKQEIDEVNEVFSSETASVTAESPNHGHPHPHSSYVLKTGDNVFRNETVIKSPTDFVNSQSSTTVSNFIIQQQRAPQIGQVHHIIPNRRPTLESDFVKEIEMFKKSREVELLTQFIKYCIIKKTESDQVSGNNSVSASSSQLPTTLKTKIPVPNVASSNNSSTSVIKRVPMSNYSLEEPCHPLDLTKVSNQRTMLLQGQTSLPSTSRPLQPDCIQPSLEPSSSNQLLVFNNNRHSPIAARQFPAPDRVCSLVSDYVKPSVLAHTQSNKSQFLKSDPALPFGHIFNHTQPLSDHIRPYVNIAPNLACPNNYNGTSVPSMSAPFPLEKYDGGQLHVFNQAKTSVPDYNKTYANMKSIHVRPYDYNGNGHSKSDPVSIEKYDGGQLYICEQAHASVSDRNKPSNKVKSNHIHSSNYNGNGHSKSESISLEKYDVGQLYKREQAQASVPNRNKPNNKVKFIHNHPSNYNGNGHLKSESISLEKYDVGQLYTREQAQASVSDRNKPNNKMKSNHIHPSNYNGNGHSKSNTIPLTKYDGGHLYICEQAPASVSDHNKLNNKVKSNHIHPSNYNGNGHSKSESTPLEKYDGGQLYICEQVQPSLSDSNTPNNNIKSNHVHPSNHNSNRRSKSELIPIEKYCGGQLYICDQTQTLPEQTKSNESMKSNAVPPHNNNGSGQSMPTLISLDEDDSGRLYICDQAQPPVHNHIAPYVNNGDRPVAPGTSYPAVIGTGEVLIPPGNQYNDIDLKNLSGGRLWEYKPNDPPVKPLHVKIGAMTLNKIRAKSPIETCNPTQRLKTQPRPLPHNRSVLKVETKQKSEGKAPPPSD